MGAVWPGRSLVLWFTLVALLPQSQQRPQVFQEKRFKIGRVLDKNGTIMLQLKSHYGLKGANGAMGDQGPPGISGPPGPAGERGSPGSCPIEMCNAMRQVDLLVSRVDKLEKFMQSRGLMRDQSKTLPGDSPVVALHITSDILFTKTNNSNIKNGISGLPRSINLNIALKNDVKNDMNSSAPVLQRQHNGKFLVNSTVFMDQIARAPARLDGETMTESHFQTPQSGYQHGEVPSIKRNKIPFVWKP